MKGLIKILSGKERIKIGKSSKSSLGFKNINTNWRISKKAGVFDFDRDGVADKFDCEPFNRNRQHRDKGDWMDTKMEKPSLANEPEDWMGRHMKRKPVVASRKISVPFKTKSFKKMLVIKVINKYGSITKLSNWFANVLTEKLSEGEYKDFPFRKDIVVVYDSNRKVYHFVDIRYGIDEDSEIVLSVTASDRKKYGDEVLYKYMRRTYS